MTTDTHSTVAPIARSNSWAETEARYAKRFPGWRLSHRYAGAFHLCHLLLMGKRRTLRSLQEHHCICHPYRSLFDHARFWRLPDGRKAVTAEPYHIDEREIALLLESCRSLGFIVERSDDSPWFPGYTKLLIITLARGERDAQ